MLLIDIIDVFFFEYLRLVDARFNLSWRLIAMQFLHFNTVLFLDSAQLKSCILQFRCQYRLHVLPNLFTSLVRRLCSVKFFEFHVAFFDQGHYLATKLRCFDLQSLAVGEEWVFNALRVQFLKVFHLAFDFVDIVFNFFLDIDIDWRQVSGTEVNRATACDTRAVA